MNRHVAVSPVRAVVLGLIAVFAPEFVVDQIVEIDMRKELGSNQQLAASGATALNDFRGRLRIATLDRAAILRRALFRSLITLLSAVVLAFVVHAGTRFPSRANDGRVLSLISVGLFVWATLGRMGWAGQSVKGDTAMERTDDFVFRGLYWLGSFAGTLSVLSP